MKPTTIAGMATARYMNRQPASPNTPSWLISAPASGAPMTVVSGWAR